MKFAVETLQIMSLSTLDVICETAMGVKLNALYSEHPYAIAVKQYTQLAAKRFFQPHLYNDFIYYNLSSEGRMAKQHLHNLNAFSDKV
jgi:cytochrome P450 family 4